MVHVISLATRMHSKGLHGYGNGGNPFLQITWEICGNEKRCCGNTMRTEFFHAGTVRGNAYKMLSEIKMLVLEVELTVP